MEERFQRKNGYEADCDVIYGDTDSVMVHFRVKARAPAPVLLQLSMLSAVHTPPPPTALWTDDSRDHLAAAMHARVRCTAGPTCF